MRNYSLVIFLLAVLSSTAFTQVKVDPVDETRVVDVELSEFCREDLSKRGNDVVDFVSCDPFQHEKLENKLQVEPFKRILTTINDGQTTASNSRKDSDTCKTVMALTAANAAPLQIQVQDESKEGKPFLIRFHFGHTQTLGSEKPTDIHIKSSDLTTTIRGTKFDERTSDKYFNPSNWGGIGDSLKWIDEPSNSIGLSIEFGKVGSNIIYLNSIHTKPLISWYEEKKIVNGQEIVSYNETTNHMTYGTPAMFAAIPENQRAINIQNTHKHMIWQIGYGRKIDIIEGKKSGDLTYVPRVDVGISTGQARSIIVDNGQWFQAYDKHGVQGINASVGHRIEYKRGAVALFVEQRAMFEKKEHVFQDGTAKYNLQYNAYTAGIIVDLYKSKKEKKINQYLRSRFHSEFFSKKTLLFVNDKYNSSSINRSTIVLVLSNDL